MTFVFLFFCSPIFRVKSQGGQCRRFCNSFSIQRLIERGIHYLIKSSHFHPNCRINQSISLCRSSLCIWYKNQSFKFSHGNTMDDSYIYKTWVVFSFKNNDLHSSVCKLMFRGKVFNMWPPNKWQSYYILSILFMILYTTLFQCRAL